MSDGEEPALFKDKLVDVLLRRFLAEPELDLTSAHTHTNISTHTHIHTLSLSLLGVTNTTVS